MRDYRKLNVWQKSHQLVLGIYHVTRGFPPEELYDLSGQMRRAAVSIPSNIAEGCGRMSEKELVRFLDIASGSVNEVEYQLQLSSDLGYTDPVTCRKLSDDLAEVRKMLIGLSRSISPDRTGP